MVEKTFTVRRLCIMTCFSSHFIFLDPVVVELLVATILTVPWSIYMYATL
jgi:hypothetical protein